MNLVDGEDRSIQNFGGYIPLEIGNFFGREGDGRIAFYIAFRGTCRNYGRWMELAQDRVQWWALVLAVLNLRVLLPES
jgi:hypothetical protein